MEYYTAREMNEETFYAASDLQDTRSEKSQVQHNVYSVLPFCKKVG